MYLTRKIVAASKEMLESGKANWAVKYAAATLSFQLRRNTEGMVESVFPRPIKETPASYFLGIKPNAHEDLKLLRKTPALEVISKQEAQLRKAACVFGVEVAGKRYSMGELIQAEISLGQLPGNNREERRANLCIVNHGIPSENRFKMLSQAFQNPMPDVDGAHFLADQLLLPHFKAALGLPKHNKDDADIKEPGQTILTHSHGSIYSFVAATMATNQLINSGVKGDKLQNTLNHFHQIKLGMPMPLHDANCKPSMPELYIVSQDDMFFPKGSAVSNFIFSDEVFKGSENDPYASFYDENNPQRMMVVLKPGVVPSRTMNGLGNLGSHGLAQYLTVTLGKESERRQDMKDLSALQTAMLRRDPDFNFATNPSAIEEAHKMIGAAPLSASKVQQYEDQELDVRKLMENMVTKLETEHKAWDNGKYPPESIGKQLSFKATLGFENRSNSR